MVGKIRKKSKWLFLLLFGTGMLVSAAHSQSMPVLAPLGLDAASAKQKVAEIGLGNDLTIKRKDAREFAGSITRIGDKSVTIADLDLKLDVEVPYNQVQDISPGVKIIKHWNGKAKVTSKQRQTKIAGMFVGLIPFLIHAAAH